ncbi:FAD-binding oxidoreductase [Streptomyces werraensis]|uniref:FAD-binding oxidoreductase n=1 Tax=Streptomyces werraensis TaxID=68284 RepID=UPI003818F5AC
MRPTPDPGRTALALPAHLIEIAIRPGDHAYDNVRHTYTRLGTPAAVLRVRGHSDIAEALAYARTAGTPLTVRSGGHGISGRSTNDDGIVIDLARLDAVEILDEDAGLVRVGAGARWGDVAKSLASYGLALSSGDTGDVGVGGLATAGGIGLMSRQHGLTIDHIHAVKVVMADGSSQRVDADHDPDLFWALRGAGANFGVATAFEFHAVRIREVITAFTLYDARRMSSFLTNWGAAVEAAPRAVSSFLTLVQGPDGRPFGHAMTVYAGSERHAALAALAPVLAAGPVLRNDVTVMPYHRLVPAHHRPQCAQQPLTESRSGLLDRITLSAAEAIGRVMTAAGIVQLRSVGGAVNDTAPGAMAYAHRTQKFSLMAATTPALVDDLDDRWEVLHPHLNGLYLNFETRTGRRQLQDAFPGAVLDRLIALKARHDPHHLFDSNFALPSA